MARCCCAFPHVRLPPACGIVALALCPALAQTQTARVTGQVSDSATSAALDGARVVLLSGGVRVGIAESDGRGRFRFLGVNPGSYAIQVSRIGYAPSPVTPIEVGSGEPTVSVRLADKPFTLEPVVVTANLALETTLRSASAVTVVPRAKLQSTVATTIADHLRDVPGIDFAAKGFFTHSFGARGPRSVTSSDLLMLSDYRYAALPVLEFNVAGLVPATTEDLERIEVVRGPGAVVYGPNSRRGVVHFISRSPLGEPGTNISVGGGQQSFADVSFRISRRVGERFGLKLSARYARADEWSYTDPVEAQLRALAIGAGANPDTLLIGRRLQKADVYQSEGRVDWMVSPGTVLITAAGVSRGTGVETGAEAGAAQSNGWRTTFFQSRLEHPHIFANALLNLSDAGDVYNLRSGGRLTENSRLFAAQLQYRTEHGPVRLQTGGDFRWGIPRTGGTLNGRFEDDDDLRETGIYAYSSFAATPRVELSGSLRLDHHNRLADAYFLSPRAAVVFKPGANHALRASWSRSFAQPSARGLFPDLNLGPLGPLPYSIRLEGSAGRGFSFDRTCGGLCMRIPAAFAGGQVVRAPASATLTWPAMVAFMQSQGVDLSGVPVPTAADVGTQLGLLNPASQTFTPVTAADVVDVDPVKRTIESSFETGYKGYLSNRIFATVDLHYTRASHVFATTSTVNTPNVFYDPVTLATYLAQYMSAPQAQAVAAAISSVPVGTISPREVPGADLLIFQPATQGGRYSFWGTDITVGWQASDRVSITGGYSYASKDSTGLGRGAGHLLFQTPRHKGTLAMEVHDTSDGYRGYLRGRTASAFSVSTPAYVGRVDAFAVFDLGTAIRLPFARDTWLSLDALNLLGHRHAEFIGTPRIGRLLVSRLSVTF